MIFSGVLTVFHALLDLEHLALIVTLMTIERPIPEEEYEPLNQPERIDKAQQDLWDIKQQIEPVGIGNKEEIKSALITLGFMLADAYDEVIERQVFPPD